MENIVLVGSGGCMREILWQIYEGKNAKEWKVLGYVDNKKAEGNEDCYVSGICCPYLGDDMWLLEQKSEINVAITVGNPGLRRKIVQKLKKNEFIKFPTLILGSAQVCKDIEMGQGCIISTECCISTNVKIGNFVFVNIGGMICHNGIIGDFVTISPRAALAGAVRVGENSDIGMGTHVIQGIEIGKNVVVGDGSAVIRNIADDCKAVGVPTRNL